MEIYTKAPCDIQAGLGDCRESGKREKRQTYCKVLLGTRSTALLACGFEETSIDIDDGWRFGRSDDPCRPESRRRAQGQRKLEHNSEVNMDGDATRRCSAVTKAPRTR